MKKYNVAIVGLGFGAEFIPIYLKHPLANMYAICQRNEEKLNAIGDAYGIEKRYSDFEALIQDPDVDVIHINSPIHLHAEPPRWRNARRSWKPAKKWARNT